MMDLGLGARGCWRAGGCKSHRPLQRFDIRLHSLLEQCQRRQRNDAPLRMVQERGIHEDAPRSRRSVRLCGLPFLPGEYQERVAREYEEEMEHYYKESENTGNGLRRAVSWTISQSFRKKKSSRTLVCRDRDGGLLPSGAFNKEMFKGISNFGNQAFDSLCQPTRATARFLRLSRFERSRGLRTSNGSSGFFFSSSGGSDSLACLRGCWDASPGRSQRILYSRGMNARTRFDWEESFSQGRPDSCLKRGRTINLRRTEWRRPNPSAKVLMLFSARSTRNGRR